MSIEIKICPVSNEMVSYFGKNMIKFYSDDGRKLMPNIFLPNYMMV